MLFGLKNAGFKKGRQVAPSFAFLFVMALSLGGLLSLTGCETVSKPDKKFVDAFVDMRVIELCYGVESPMTRLLRQETLRNYGYTREQYLAETERLLDNENAWVPFQKAVVERVDSLLAAQQTSGNVQRSSKTVDMPPRKGGGGE